MRSIVISIKKGGVGKTTTAVNLAAAISKKKRVLLVDLDPQANATVSCGINIESLKYSIYDLFENVNINTKDSIIKTSFGIDIIPSHTNLIKIQSAMTEENIGELRAILNSIDNNYDFIIIDTPPSESYLNLSAFAYAKEVIITVETHFLSMYGLKQLFETINFIKKKLNPSLNILGILPTKVYRKTNMHKETLNVLKSRFEDLILPVSIDFTIKHAYASMCGKPLVVIDPKHRSSVSYKNLAKLIINQ